MGALFDQSDGAISSRSQRLTGDTGSGSRSIGRDLRSVLAGHRLFLEVLVQSDLRIKYARSFLGIAWSFLMPLALTSLMAAVLALLFEQPYESYLLYVYSGFVAWELITAGALQGGQSFIVSESLLRAFTVPPVAYVLRTSFASFVTFCIAFIGVLGWSAVEVGPNWAWASLPLNLALALAFNFSIAVPAAFLVTTFRDSSQMLILMFQGLWYISPVFISTAYLTQGSGLAAWSQWNPIGAYLELFRAPLMDSRWPSGQAYALVACTVILLLGLGAIVYRMKASRIVMEI